MALPLIPILLLGGAVMVLGGAKKGGGRLLVIDANCQRIVYPPPANHGQLVSLVRKVAKVMSQSMTNLGYHMTPAQAVSDEKTMQVLLGPLGPAPGDQGTNLLFAKAYASEFIRLTTDPGCALPPGPLHDQDEATLPAAVASAAQEMYSEMITLLGGYGYDVGAVFSAFPAESPAHRLAGRIA